MIVGFICRKMEMCVPSWRGLIFMVSRKLSVLPSYTCSRLLHLLWVWNRLLRELPFCIDELTQQHTLLLTYSFNPPPVIIHSYISCIWLINFTPAHIVKVQTDHMLSRSPPWPMENVHERLNSLNTIVKGQTISC